MPARDLQHLVNKCLVADACVDRLGRFFLFLCDPGLGIPLVFGLVLQRDRLE